MDTIFVPMYRPTSAPRRVQGRPWDHPFVYVSQPSLFELLMSGALAQLRDGGSSRNERGAVTTKETDHPWVHELYMQGFKQDEVSVKVNDRIVNINAKHVTESESGNDVIERNRKVPLPENVDAEKLTCFFTDDGKLILTSPYIKSDVPEQMEVGATGEAGSKQDTSVEVMNQKDGETAMKLKENLLEIKEMKGDEQNGPLVESTRVVEGEGGAKKFEVVTNLHHFKPENTSIRCNNGILQINAEKEVNEEGLSFYQKVHREYSLPSEGVMDGADAAMNQDGLLRITVPLQGKQ